MGELLDQPLSKNNRTAYQTRSLGEVGITLLDCEHRTPKPAVSGFPYIAIPNLRQGRIDLSSVRLISKKDLDDWTRKTKPQAGDIIVSRRGRVGDTAVVPAGLECAIGQNLVILRSDGSKVDQSYLRWALRGPFYEAEVDRMLNVGAVFNSLNCRDIVKIRIPVPPLNAQVAIASILGDLDDKIDLNHRMNQTLEAMASAIFKSWFVDFDPVREEHPLFPRAYARSTDSLIPEGWTLGQLEDIIEVIDCLHSKKPERRPEGKPLLQLGNILDSGLLDMKDMYLIAPEDYELWTSRMEAREGDCVITNVGRVGAVAQIPRGLRAALGRNMTGLRCRPEFLYPTFLIESLRSPAMREEIGRKTDSGTILDSLNVRNIPKLRLLIPTTPVVREFERLFRPIRAKMESNLEESRTLAALSDTLLPKLLSGEIRVKEAEKIVGEVT